MFLNRFVIAATALAVLTACDVDPPRPTGEEVVARRIAQGMDAIESCRASECMRLDLDSRLVRDYSIVANMTHVTVFMASYSDFDTLDDIATMTQLRELHLGGTRLTDLSGLRSYPNLTLLHVQQSQNINDFGPIGQLRNLQELAIGFNDVGELSFLRGTNSLTSLNLQNAEIASFAGIRRHQTLEILDLEGADLPDDLSVLKTIPNLQSLSISDWDLTDAQMTVVDDLNARGVTILRKVEVTAC